MTEERKPIQIVSKFFGYCKLCREPYQIGETVEWIPGRTEHVGCRDGSRETGVQTGDMNDPDQWDAMDIPNHGH